MTFYQMTMDADETSIVNRGDFGQIFTIFIYIDLHNDEFNSRFHMEIS